MFCTSVETKKRTHTLIVEQRKGVLQQVHISLSLSLCSFAYFSICLSRFSFLYTFLCFFFTSLSLSLFLSFFLFISASSFVFSLLFGCGDTVESRQSLIHNQFPSHSVSKVCCWRLLVNHWLHTNSVSLTSQYFIFSLKDPCKTLTHTNYKYSSLTKNRSVIDLLSKGLNDLIREYTVACFV